MFIKRFLGLSVLLLTLVGCVKPGENRDWNADYGTMPTGAPAQIQSGLYYAEYDMYGRPDNFYGQAPAELKNVSVLLPMSGPNSAVGKSISRSVEMAFLKNRYSNVSVTFYDLTGNKAEKQGVIFNALATNPDVVIGPIFAEDARLVRDMKPETLPVLTFSSDTSAIGNGVMTTALIPSQSVEVIVKEMINDHATGLVIMAPKTPSGERMASAAVQATNLYDMPLSGLFYYDEGNTDSIKAATQKAAMYVARSGANTKARKILADILVKENLTASEKASIEKQLEKISKSDTLGNVPYDAILFLGNASDSKTIASFLRYYDVAARDARFYGTALWDNSELLKDFSMAGARFAALPPISPEFTNIYEQVSGGTPSRLDSFGYDAANLVLAMLHSSKDPAAFLLDPSGYRGLDGLFRLRPAGQSERALEIVETNGSGTTRLVRASPRDFMTPIYNIDSRKLSRVSEMDLVGPGVNPMDYIKIPQHLTEKYHSKTFGANTKPVAKVEPTTEVVILPEDDSDPVTTEEFKPISLEPIDRKLIDSVEIEE